MNTKIQSQEQDNIREDQQKETEEKQVIHPFGSDKEISLEDIEKEQ